jgi:hypothetical protein
MAMLICFGMSYCGLFFFLFGFLSILVSFLDSLVFVVFIWFDK